MFTRIKNKIESKNGGLKELLYDNIGIFIVGVLIVVTLFTVSNQLRTRTTGNESTINAIETELKKKTFTNIDIPNN